MLTSRCQGGYLQVVKDQREPTQVEFTEAVFAHRMRELRDELGISQAALAERVTKLGLKMDDLTILRIEKNADDAATGRRVRIGEAVIIAQALEVDLDSMLRPANSLETQLQRVRDLLQHEERSVSGRRAALNLAEGTLRRLQLQEKDLTEKLIQSNVRSRIDDWPRNELPLSGEEVMEILRQSAEAAGVSFNEYMERQQRLAEKHTQQLAARRQTKDGK